MLNASLFLGFPVSSVYAEKLLEIDPLLLELFFSENKESYLQEITVEKIRYLGKNIGEIVFLSDLILMKNNIYSILTKIVPDYPHEDVPLVLMAAPPCPIEC